MQICSVGRSLLMRQNARPELSLYSYFDAIEFTQFSNFLGNLIPYFREQRSRDFDFSVASIDCAIDIFKKLSLGM